MDLVHLYHRLEGGGISQTHEFHQVMRLITFEICVQEYVLAICSESVWEPFDEAFSTFSRTRPMGISTLDVSIHR